MRLGTRHMLDRAFTATGVLSIVLMTAALVILLAPMFARGAGAFVFRGTVEYRRFTLERFDRGDATAVRREIKEVETVREPVFRMLAAYEKELNAADSATRRKYGKWFKDVSRGLHDLLGPAPGTPAPMLMRNQYGQTRWDRAEVKVKRVLFREEWDYSDPSKAGILMLKPRAEDFAGTSLAPLFAYVEANAEKMLRPKLTFYWRFLTDVSYDSHFFGGVWPELLGTFYLTIGAMLFAVPIGIIAAIYLAEYAREGRIVQFLRTCISTLAGVPSIVFGLFGLAFFINAVGVSNSKSVLVGSLTLALLILPTVIRAAEEAIRAVPLTYKEAALSLGAGRWHAVMTIILPASLPGILTGAVISMGRAAGETAPIIFTAAVSVGKPLTIFQAFNQATPALSWNIYNLATEHAAVEEIRHVQYGMVLVLVALVLLLNLTAIILRARISKRLRA